MDIETRRRIRAYKKALPELRERVIAVALLLAMSASMLTSASFAWITLSRAPEVTGMQTTVAANGNLEIALAQGPTTENGSVKAAVAPDESAVGDSASEKGIVGSNVTWGNLVNLSDPTYGISAIELRPADLKSSGRRESPLIGATYGKDGRIIGTASEYKYASWREDDAGDTYFDAGNVDYGVRAITSIKYASVSTDAALKKYWDNIDGTNGAYPLANQAYLDLIQGRTMVGVNKTGMQALTDMITIYAQAQVDEVMNSKFSLGVKIKDDYSSCITYFYRLMKAFLEILKYEGEALRNMANLQIMMATEGSDKEHFKTLEDLVAVSQSELKNTLKVELESFDTFRKNYTTLRDYVAPGSDLSTLAAAYDPDDPTITIPKEAVPWTTVNPYVSSIVNISMTNLNGTAITKLAGAGYSKLMELLDESTVHDIEIGDGIIEDTEQRLGTCMEDYNVVITIKVNTHVLGTKNVRARVTTTAKEPFLSDNDMDKTEEVQGGSVIQGTDPVAKDTYGMAIDLWVRTNADSSVLTLEGHKIYTTELVMIEDPDGNKWPTYVVTSGDQQFEAYQKTDGTWYYASSHAAMEEGTSIDETVPREESYIVGFEGENRVWDNDSLVWEDLVHDGHIAQDRTTQGSGSCFVFYANPSEQNSIMELLKGFQVFFMDKNGMELGRAYLNTEDAYAINGKVTVPIEMFKGVEYTATDEYGLPEDGIGIVSLPQNEPTFVTAIIYLDGTQINNKNVLASGEIQGQLNLQFGSSVTMTSINDDELQQQYRSISAVATYGSETSDSESSPIGGQTGLSYDGNPKTVNVKLTVNGDQPQKISGFFVRSISDTQGTREKPEDFIRNDDGTWSADFEFATPGKYMLRSIMVDGVEYPLMRYEEDVDTGVGHTVPAYPTVVIKGLDVSNIRVTNANGATVASGEYMTADTRWQVFVQANVNATADLMPSSVRAVFMDEETGQEFSAIMSYDENSKNWGGSATITRSGTYTLSYIVLDGQYTKISGPTYTIKLGMKTRVWADPGNATVDGIANTDLGSTSFVWTYEEVLMPISIELYDDADKELENLNATKIEIFFPDATGADDRALTAHLTWDAGMGRYKGTLAMDGPGRFTFGRVDVLLPGASEENRVENAEFAPTIIAMPPDLPMYGAEYTTDVQKVWNSTDTASMRVSIAYASAAKVAAVFQDISDPNNPVTYAPVVAATGDAVEVQPGVNGNFFDFPIPTKNGTQDGKWRLSKLYFQDVWKDGQAIEVTDVMTEENSYVINLDTPVEAYVIETLTPVVTHQVNGNTQTYTGQNLGGTLATSTVPFLTNQAIDPLQIKIVDWNNQVVPDVKQAKLTFTYDTTKVDGKSYSEIYGGYTASKTPSPDPAVMTGSGVFTTPAGYGLSVAGRFTGAVEVKFTDNLDDTGAWFTNLTLANDIVVTVASKKPTVTISSVSTNPTTARYYLTSTPSSLNVITGSYNRKIDNYNAVVYMYVAEKSGTLDQEQVVIKYPTVNLSLSGVPSTHSGATMVFPSGNNTSSTFTFAAGSTTASSTIGAGTDGVFNEGVLGFGSGVDTWPVFYPAGKQTVSQINVTYGGIEYTVNLTNAVTINNPLYPPYVDFGDIFSADTSFDGTTPPMLYSTDGETVTLPSIPNTWTYQEGRPVNELVYGDYVETETLGKYYYQKNWYSTAYHYHLNLYVRTGEVVSDIYDITKKVQWNINGKIYNPGDTVEISGAVTATPVITKVSEQYVEQKIVTYTEESQMYVDVGRGSGYTKLNSPPETNVRFNIKVTVN